MTLYEKGRIVVFCVNAVLVLISLPLVFRKVPRNVVYGFRTRATLSDDAVWYDANAHFGRGLIFACLVSAFGFAALVQPGGAAPSTFLWASVAAFTAPPAVATLVTLRYVRRLTQGDPTRLTPR